MADEQSDGVSYLKALRQTSSPDGTAAAPAKASDAPATALSPLSSTSQSFQGGEKRRSPRYKCEGSAHICEEDCDVGTWATFTDVSLHGCYVEAQATYPAGTAVNLKLEANGIKVEGKGTVRVTYPYLGMGIAFSEMSDHDRTRLKELLGTISRPSVIMGPGIASSLPTCGPLDSVPLISDPAAAIQALIEFFESRHMLTREDFLMVLRKSQVVQPRLAK